MDIHNIDGGGVLMLRWGTCCPPITPGDAPISGLDSTNNSWIFKPRLKRNLPSANFILVRRSYKFSGLFSPM
jgi:hypothetical protein